MDLRPYVPVRGEMMAELTGGPHDKLAMWFDVFPLEIRLDGHVYRLHHEHADENDEHMAIDEWEYRYAGKDVSP